MSSHSPLCAPWHIVCLLLGAGCGVRHILARSSQAPRTKGSSDIPANPGGASKRMVCNARTRSHMRVVQPYTVRFDAAALASRLLQCHFRCRGESSPQPAQAPGFLSHSEAPEPPLLPIIEEGAGHLHDSVVGAGCDRRTQPLVARALWPGDTAKEDARGFGNWLWRTNCHWSGTVAGP